MRSTRSRATARKGYEVLPLYARLTSARQRRILDARQGAADRARDEHRRDVADRAADPLRDRLGARAREPLRHAASRAELRRRADRAGERRAARGPLRPARARRLRAAVCRGGLRGAARVHGARDSAHRARGRAAEARGAAARTRRGVSVHRRAAGEGRAATPISCFICSAPSTPSDKLTADGELMARLPVDPRVARLLVVANRNGALREGLVIAAALSVVDPREHRRRPATPRGASTRSSPIRARTSRRT